MEEKIEQAYLYDFYGELLNEHQRRIYEDFVFNDLSLGEIANEEGISRQGVHDMIKRCTFLPLHNSYPPCCFSPFLLSFLGRANPLHDIL